MLLLAGPLVAVVGIVAVFFVLRRKSVDKRSMYSARRSQIEHKVRAARQRTLAPHGHVDKPAEAAAAPTVAQQPVQQVVTWERTAFDAPPVAAPPPPPGRQPEAPAAMPWETPSTPAPSSFDYPATSPEPSFQPSPEPAPSEPVWTPSAQPPIEVVPREPEPVQSAQAAAAAAAASAAAAGSWSIVSTEKDAAAKGEPAGKKKKKRGAATDASAWQLASGDAPGMETGEEGDVRRSSAALVAVAQYVVLVVGLVMVLIGVLVMVANSHVT